MPIRYYRINRAAYAVRELTAITVGPRRFLLPAYIARLFLLKFLGKTTLIGDAIADTRLMTPLDVGEAEAVCDRYVLFRDANSRLAPLGFSDSRYYRSVDPRSPYENFSRYSIDVHGSIAVVGAVMSRGEQAVDWIEYYSLLADGRTLRSNNHPLAGVLRPVPSAIIRKAPGACWQRLLSVHREEMEHMESRGDRFIGGMNLDRAVEADRDYYRDQIVHWIETGLLVPDPNCDAT